METGISFRSYQRQAILTNRVRGNDQTAILVPLLGLAGEAGSLLSEYKKWIREGDRYRPFTDQVAEEIGDILWYLANIAEKEGLDLGEIAEENLAKIADRFDDGKGPTRPLFPAGRYDSAYPENERLPSTLEVEFREVDIEGRKKIETIVGGERFGDSLTDNAHADDGYRFHDVFHFANAILLGWSPIVRKYFGVKRKSVPHVDEIEDGARARVTEEAISAAVFGYAKDFSFFDGSDTVEYDLLRMIKQMTAPYEVRDAAMRQWEIAILEGYKVWRQMAANRGGILVGDARIPAVRYKPLPSPLQ